MRVKAKESLAAAREAREAQIRAAARRAENGGNENGRKRRRRGNSIESTMYDSSDSYENHVIDLRGSPNRANGIDDGESPLRDAQSEGEGSLENGNARVDCDLGHYLSNGNGRSGKHRHVIRNESPEEEEYDEPLKPREHDFVPGQLVWAKFARFPWWPAQVMDARDAVEGTGGKPGADTDLLVRFFGTYDYGWIDPFNNLSDFDVKLTERSKIRKKALQKGVEEALIWRSSGALPEKWEQTSKSIKQKRKENTHSNGVVSSTVEVKESRTDAETKERRAPRKRKPKVLFEVCINHQTSGMGQKLHLLQEEGRIQRKPQRMQRRLRIMRQLGLAAPAGSPFTADFLRT
ncbi:hypothetical protein Mp_2g00770 [Marchantia polymorpha subsp. ruderalis]|uniref:PWWP domain-containing protein n=1 Tax=Marchantia polymorpha TaxID=3197 RepID=A0A2R6X9J7_MARPO|nr:hypothetical protein MARPO_0028s0074 [Marchantia polymorpha]BBN00637.1 hypothetical protein Mp_2g00770 [Marchantia polymorpha subsp. ruderalis]|eukprot:PTQ42759.1 hypothetical protein MARPO_0028s0074 [Marchantia polymorpha]